jgi:ribose 5-phosphate isomerase A
VAFAASRFVLIGDDSKVVRQLGEKAPVPVEVAAFGHQRTGQLLHEMSGGATLRLTGGEPFVTDNGNLVYDCRFEPGFEAPTLALALAELPGVVEHGLFLDLADVAYVASAEGVTELGPEGPL